MGIVFEAIDEKLDRRVALKCAKLGHGHRLPPEARAAREVSHFNVCKVYDLHAAVTDLGDLDFLSMEFIEGQTLSERIYRDGPVPEKEAREIARQICAGLAQAHRQGVIHGDLKCSNVILTRSDGGLRAVITDFGLARLNQAGGDRFMSPGRGGTLDYMAPELLLSHPASVASDLYALGVLFHHMLTGRTPERIDPTTSGNEAGPSRFGILTPELPRSLSPANPLRETGSGAWNPFPRVGRRLCGVVCKHGRRPLRLRHRSRRNPRIANLQSRLGQHSGRRPRRLFRHLVGRPSAQPVRLAVLPFAVEGDPNGSAARNGSRHRRTPGSCPAQLHCDYAPRNGSQPGRVRR